MSIIQILSWNVNGIRAVHRKGFLEWFNEAQPDILGLQETKATDEQVPEDLTGLDGYQDHFAWASKKKGWSGVGLYTRPEPVSVSSTFASGEFDDEGRVLAADYGDFILFNVYFPNGKMSDERLQYKLRFYDAFLEHIEALRAQGKCVIFCGDVNTAHTEIDLARPKANEKISGFLPIEREWMDKAVDMGWVDTFRMFDKEPERYSWWSNWGGARQKNVGWRIDYFFINEEFKDRVKSAYILTEVMGSDHCPIGIDLEV